MNKISKKYLDKYYMELINVFKSQNYSHEISKLHKN